MASPAMVRPRLLLAPLALLLALMASSTTTASAASVDVAKVGVPISISFGSSDDADGGDALAHAKVMLCALDWAAYRADPSASPMFRDVVSRSRCSGGRTATVPFSELEAEYEQRGCGEAATSPAPPAAAGVPAAPPSSTAAAGCVPTGMVFHQSRCGSTLVANMLASIPEALTYSESSPPSSILSNTKLSERDRVRALRVIVAAMGRPVYIHSQGLGVPHSDDDWDPQHLFFKFQSTLTLQLGTVRRAFPAVPWAFVHRDGVEVLASLLRGAPVTPADGNKRGGVDPDDATVRGAPCMRSRDADAGPHPALLAATGSATADEARELPAEDFCAASVGLLAASALHHAREARRDGLARAGLLPPSSSISSSSDLDVGDGAAVARAVAVSSSSSSSSPAAVVALGGMLLDAAAGRGAVAGVGQGVFVDYPSLPDAAVGLVRSHFGAPVADESAQLMMDESAKYSKARLGKKGEGEDTAAAAEASAKKAAHHAKKRSRRQEEEHGPAPSADGGGDGAAASSGGLRVRPGMDADGNFVGDAQHKRQNAWPELRGAADRYTSAVRAAMLLFNPPADGVLAAAADPALQALLKSYGPAGPAMAEAAAVAAGLRPAAGAGASFSSPKGGGGPSRAASVPGLPSLPGPLAAAALGLYGPPDAAPLEVGLNASRHDLPLGKGYPMLFPLAAMLAEWNPDVTTPPPTYGRYSSLRAFDWRTERAEAEAYRRAEVPFLVRHVPSLVAAAAKWADDAALLDMMGADKEYGAEAVDGNHFMYFSRGRGEAKDWVPPTEEATITISDWLKDANRIAGEVVAEERAALPAWWFADSADDAAVGGNEGGATADASSASSAAARLDVSEAVAPPANRRRRRLHYVRATAYPERRGEDGPRAENQFILDELPLFDPVAAKPPKSVRRRAAHRAAASAKKRAAAAKKRREQWRLEHEALEAAERGDPSGADAAPADDGSDLDATAAAHDNKQQPISAQAAREAPFFVVDASQQRGVHCRLGMPGTIAENHYDGSRNFVSIQRGRRRYIIAPPSECANMALLTDGPSSRHSEVDWSDPAQHGALANALALEVILEPGDALYLPAGWFHYISSLGVTVQCNTRSGRPLLYVKELGRCGFHISNVEASGQHSDADAVAKQPDRARHAAALWQPHWPSLAAVARGLGRGEEAVLEAQRKQVEAEDGASAAAAAAAAERMVRAVADALKEREDEYGADVAAA